jgi:hypothetical protein
MFILFALPYKLSHYGKYHIQIFTEPNEIKNYDLDGSTWYLEIQYNGDYKELNVWQPEYGVVYEIGQKLMQFSGMKLDVYGNDT